MCPCLGKPVGPADPGPVRDILFDQFKNTVGEGRKVMLCGIGRGADRKDPVLFSGNDDTILLNLTAAGQNVSLPPGRYWLVVNANSTFANRWVWSQSTQGSGLPGAAAITVSQTNTGAWTTQTATTFAGLAMRVNIDVPCGAPWIGGTYAASGSLARGTSRSALTVLYGTGLTPGNYSGIVCVQSNDPVTPRLSLPVSLTITP